MCGDDFCSVLFLFYLCFAEVLKYVNLFILPKLEMFQPLFLQIFILILSLFPCLWHSNYTYARHFLIVPEASHIRLREHVWQFFCLVSNFSHTYFVKAH